MGKHFLVKIEINTNSVSQKKARSYGHLNLSNEKKKAHHRTIGTASSRLPAKVISPLSSPMIFHVVPNPQKLHRQTQQIRIHIESRHLSFPSSPLSLPISRLLLLRQILILAMDARRLRFDFHGGVNRV